MERGKPLIIDENSKKFQSVLRLAHDWLASNGKLPLETTPDNHVSDSGELVVGQETSSPAAEGQQGKEPLTELNLPDLAS